MTTTSFLLFTANTCPLNLFVRVIQVRRGILHGPLWTNLGTLFVEVVVIADYDMYLHYDSNTYKVIQHVKEVVSVANAVSDVKWFSSPIVLIVFSVLSVATCEICSVFTVMAGFPFSFHFLFFSFSFLFSNIL